MIPIIVVKFCLSLFLFWVFETRSYYVALAASSSSPFFFFDLVIFRHKSVTREHCLSYTIAAVSRVIPNSLFSFSLLSFFTCFPPLLPPGHGLWDKMLNGGWGPPFPEPLLHLPQLPRCEVTRAGLDFLEFSSYEIIKFPQCFLFFLFFSIASRFTGFEINSLVLCQCLAFIQWKVYRIFSISFFLWWAFFLLYILWLKL